MNSPDRVCVVRVRRRNREYDRVYKGALKRTSAYKEWTSIVAFWRWAADVEEFGGAVPRCPASRLRRPYRDPSKDASARRRVVAASWPEAAACVAGVASWVQPLAVLCYYTGLRVKQARGLTWEDVHFNDRFAREHGGPVLWVGHGKTEAESEGRFMPLHPALVAWLRERRSSRPSLDELSRDLRRTDSAAYKARAAGLAEGRIAWEVGDQNVSLQLSRAWKEAGVPEVVWARRTCHAFRKALRTNIMDASTEPGAKAWQAAERLIGHVLPGQVDIYQSDRVLMPHMRKLVESIPAWTEAAQAHSRKVIPMTQVYEEEDLEAL
jgi:integrase